MTRLNLVLLLAVIATALYLVRVQYASRQLVGQLERARSEARRLEDDYEQLQAAKRQQAASLRVEKLAKDKLNMRLATPAITHYVGYGSTTPEVRP
jgi:cell division protein FtsL